jgi:hypothetical protein
MHSSLSQQELEAGSAAVQSLQYSCAGRCYSTLGSTAELQTVAAKACWACEEPKHEAMLVVLGPQK